ncbi:type I-C CRISPR-associated protein Cas8c/Csd1 [Paenibacillus sp. URB8-2]|uniref:type I-C CRISPR-associated protein Cas8c/Csd1 n=1 Tax=Paenibacillus sp. URB8-2 TaxID=2741301 RepID=UPI0015BF9B2B|nr:type I-C CRISPR-associated protein Cas8c/Csd1 [Paenibacillus sp. URB8-2]BCG56848.1 type I-C CRISPR-associated protein Cas8c/Csd1 [Paenibacillus sp. URB8-2]
MTWLANLHKTYENHSHVIGQFEKKKNDREYALIPVSHTTQSAHIEVNLDKTGNFVSAKVVDKSESNTIIPCTEASSSRTSSPVPHALFDKLVYVAGDFTRYCGEVKGAPYADYMRQLRSWCESDAAHPKVKSVYTYLAKGTLMSDLIREKVLWTDDEGKLLDKWTPAMETKYGEKPEIFKVIASDQSAAFVRFSVQIPGEPEARLWRNPAVQQSFIAFNEMNLAEKELCYVTGEYLPYADKHASRIRNSADKSKLISANDSSGFTYRGRFRTSRDAAAVSYEVSQKAHNALKWLIERQGIAIDGKVFLVWGTQELDLPDPLGDAFTLYQEEDELTGGDNTHKEFANRIRRAIGGYRYDSDYKSDVIIMVLDAATPGRMSIVYYRDLNKELFLDRLQHWHETCSWLHRYRKNKDNQFVAFVGAPATRDIAFAAYGPRASDKIVKNLMERMLPSIVDERRIPQDIVRSAVHRASNPTGMEDWEWEKTLSITCALINKTHEKEGFEVGLDVENTNRDYLFGRMLAIADVLERRALGKEEKRATNALRYMNAFAQHPGRTWTVIQTNLQPYQARMGTDARYYNSLLDEVGARLKPEDFTDKPLGGLYLLGFYSQRNDLYTSRKDKEAAALQANNTTDGGENE